MGIANRFYQYGLLLEGLKEKGFVFDPCDFMYCSERYMTSGLNSCRHTMIALNTLNLLDGQFITFYSKEISPGKFEYTLISDKYSETFKSSQAKVRNKILNKVDELIKDWTFPIFKFPAGHTGGIIYKPNINYYCEI